MASRSTNKYIALFFYKDTRIVVRYVWLLCQLGLFGTFVRGIIFFKEKTILTCVSYHFFLLFQSLETGYW